MGMRARIAAAASSLLAVGCTAILGITDVPDPSAPGSDAAGLPETGADAGADATTPDATMHDSGSDACASPSACGDGGSLADSGRAPADASVDDAASPPADAGNADSGAGDAASADGSTCADGGCPPTVLANSALTGMLFADGTAVYGTANGQAVAIDAASGKTVATGTTPITGLVTQSATAVFGLSTNATILYGFDKGQLVATPVLNTQGLATYLSAAYQPTATTDTGNGDLWMWIGQGQLDTGSGVFMMDGGPVPNAPSLTSASPACTVVAAHVAGAVIGLTSTSSSSTTGGPCELQAFFLGNQTQAATSAQLTTPGNPDPLVLAVGPNTAYWLNGTDGKIYASDRAGGSYVTMVASSIGQTPLQFAVDGISLYWTDSTAGTVLSLPLGSVAATPRVVVSGQPGAAGIAVDDHAVYWATSTTLMKLPKP